MSELDWVAAAGLERAVAMRTPSTRGLLTATVAGAGIAILPALYALRAGLIAMLKETATLLAASASPQL